MDLRARPQTQLASSERVKMRSGVIHNGIAAARRSTVCMVTVWALAAVTLACSSKGKDAPSSGLAGAAAPGTSTPVPGTSSGAPAKGGAPTAEPGKVSTRQLAWDLGDTLTGAALLNAEGLPPDAAARMFAQAQSIAAKLGTEVPPLPSGGGTKVSKDADMLAYLLGPAGKKLGGHLDRTYGKEHAGLFEVALKANLLYLMYQPGAKDTLTIRDINKERAAKARLSESLLKPLIDKINAKVPYEEIKKELLKMSEAVHSYLADK